MLAPRPLSRRLVVAAAALLVALAYVRIHLERRAPRTAPRPGGAPTAPRPGEASTAALHPGETPGRPDTVTAATPTWEPQLLTRLAAWVPSQPATPLARFAAYLWAAPLSLAGLAVGLSTRSRPRFEAGALLFEHARGPVAAYLRARRFSACTLGHVIIAVRDVPPPLLAHELVHVRHGERLGILLAPLYLVLLVVYGYHAHPLERAARSVQRTVERPAPQRPAPPAPASRP